jgi:hypothetical protein
MIVNENTLVNCAFCGKEKYLKLSYVNKSKTKKFFCDLMCKGEWQKTSNNPDRKRIVKRCEECSAEFEVERHMKERRRFCSISCSSRNSNKNNPKKSYKLQKKCEHCEKLFMIHRYRKNSQFCSFDCRNNYRRDIVICKCCGKEFSAPKYERRIYCSSLCSFSKTYNKSKAEKEIVLFLEQLGFLNETRKIITPSGSIIPDFICGSKVVEYYGDYWHCHENMFSEEDFNYSIGMTAKEKEGLILIGPKL